MTGYTSINIHVNDENSDITSFGKHNRLLVMRDVEFQEYITIREDCIGLNYSTEYDRRKVANSWQRMHPAGKRLFFICSQHYYSNGMERVQHNYLYY